MTEQLPFDLIKFDRSFMRQFKKESSRVILKELMQMATALGLDSICEGVETEEQVRFLQEIGCSKLQGYYYLKPISLEKLLERYERGEQIGFENPEETAYYETVGRLNLYDLAFLADEEERAFRTVFNTIPIGVMEIDGEKMTFVRSNESYKLLMMRFFGFDLSVQASGYTALPFGTGESYMRLIRQCCESGKQVIYNEVLPDGCVIHFCARRIGINPVTGKTAVATAVLSITKEAVRNRQE